MSTKIYSGFRVNTTDMRELKKLVEVFKPWVEQEQLKIPVFYLRHTRKSEEPLHTAYTNWEINKFQLEQNGHKGLSQYDTAFSILFIPCDGYTLGTTFTAQPDWHKKWLEQPGVLPYEYWDNTDYPDDISSDDWEVRGLAWDQLSHEPLSMQGFVIEASNPNGPDMAKALALYRQLYKD